jgi:hypothetical protein
LKKAEKVEPKKSWIAYSNKNNGCWHHGTGDEEAENLEIFLKISFHNF